MITYIGNIIENAPIVNPETKSSEIDQLFKEHPNYDGIVVSDQKVPIGLVTRSQFYQKLGTLYGFNVYMDRPIKLIMNPNPLIVDFFTPLTEVSSLAMQRNQEQLYDNVIVTQDSELLGIVSIRHLLTQLADIQAKIASYLNPLTGLPGNKLIDEKLAKLIEAEAFTLLYIDLDFFKAFNDTYGFQEGDRMIQKTASIIKKVLSKENAFVGHIGGDDFIAMLPHHAYIMACEELITAFNDARQSFYNERDWDSGFVFAENRNGVKENIPLVSLSIAVISNEKEVFKSVDEIINIATTLKKNCKQLHYSCYICN
ncbi:diguanylate cyclase domain-containing protein [Fictibacillus sp. 26RED30]|uniref:diguanylate cyclase domain-containing protein n=1 Tax=Fictibacillus sp. 26RED30 TaxID=2745877 RepID=UPI0018CD573B|nr:GGDEF domain-containing protein [Fictibacillus sp. 26RED30]MBH0160607.1 GGDEF domain-containing protein [Fictibacillus sp. 26RED30]